MSAAVQFLVNAALTLLWPALFTISVRRDPRRLRCGILGLLAAGTVLNLLTVLAGQVPALSILVAVGIGAFGLTLLLLPLMLMVNGVRVLRREGLRPANALSLLAGVGLIMAPVVACVLIAHPNMWTITAAMVLFTTCLYLAGFLVILLAQTLVQRIWGGRGRTPHPDAIVVHGAGLINGTVTPLLASRVRAGVRAWEEEMTARGLLSPTPGSDGAVSASPSLSPALSLARPAGHHATEGTQRESSGGVGPILVMSGGRGPDEPVSEASAMAAYARELGVPAGAILLEDRSTTTRENIRFSSELLHSLPPERRIDPDNVLLVTSDYHAVRTAILASDMTVPWAVAPAPTARYYVVGAWLREYVAVMTYRRGTAVAWAVLTAMMSAGMIAVGLMS